MATIELDADKGYAPKFVKAYGHLMRGSSPVGGVLRGMSRALAGQGPTVDVSGLSGTDRARMADWLHKDNGGHAGVRAFAAALTTPEAPKPETKAKAGAPKRRRKTREG